MRVSFEWLEELVQIPSGWTPELTAGKLAELGFPVESIEKIGPLASNVVTAKIVSVEKHPNADRLQLAKVQDGKTERLVVCGATNIAPGQVVPLALPGAKVAGGVEIALSKIRGVESYGMLCSERELGISENHAGIMQLPTNTKLGLDIKKVLDEDTVFQIDVTPNRPDAMSHIGIAREIAALIGKPVKPRKFNWKGSKVGRCQIRIKEPSLCFRYLGKIVNGIRVGPAPDWMIRRLTACGLRPINNIVDITNYVLLEWGHPLHAFDLAKLQGQEIIVRKARNGESITALDEKTYSLNPADLVVADAKNPVAIAGIMGGQLSGVDSSTTQVLLESAVFNRVTVRNASRRLNLRSESSIRFEKGTDAVTAEQASLRAAQLILELAGGEPGPSADAYPKKEKPKKIVLRSKRLEHVLGRPIGPAVAEEILARLELYPVNKKSGWECTTPHYRKDIIEEVDLIEEVIRVLGYNQIPSRVSSAAPMEIPQELQAKDLGKIEEMLRGFGLNQTITTSFSSQRFCESLGLSPDTFVSVANPLSQEETILRPSLVPNLLNAVTRNLNFQAISVSLFEIGKRFQRSSSGQPNESLVLSFVVYGEIQRKAWQTPAKEVGFYYLKGLLEAMGQSLNVPLRFSYDESRPAYLHPNQSFALGIGGETIGWAGLIHPATAANLDFKALCAVAEVSLHRLLGDRPMKTYRALPRFPLVERDIAIVVEKNKSWAEIQSEVEKAGGSLLQEAVPFDLFTGGSIPANQKSLAFRIRLQHPDHTLTESEINATIDKIRQSLKDRCGAQLR